MKIFRNSKFQMNFPREKCLQAAGRLMGIIGIIGLLHVWVFNTELGFQIILFGVSRVLLVIL